MTPPFKRGWFSLAVFAAVLLVGCRPQSSAEGSFDKTFTVNGPVRLDLTNGSGDTRIQAGAPGEVRVHGEIQARSWSEENSRHRVQTLASNPPVSQDGNLIRIGASGAHEGDVSIDYTIIVPADAELHATTGSGDVEVDGIKGPANFVSGSGAISASNISGDVQAVAGSGTIHLSHVQGQVQATAGSGDISLDSVHNETRLHTGSGDVEIINPGDSVEASTGSGDVVVRGASADLRLRTASGDVTVDGNPGASNYWDFHTSSGDVVLEVPASASLRLYARSSSGDIDAAIPIVMEGTTGKRELRARLGDGKARVEVQTSSGSVSLK
ncbi:MAG: DUF4097 family beta strand repeat-containing protein [Candidatus Acidiferrales bacterium]